jgi:hypothetical protein
MDVDFVVVFQSNSIKPDKPTSHAVANRARAMDLFSLTKAAVVFDSYNTSEQGWQCHFHAGLSCKNVEAEKMALRARKTMLWSKMISLFSHFVVQVEMEVQGS